MTVTQTWNTAELVAQDKAHLVHPVSNLHALRQHGPLVLARGDDVWIWDTDGNRYLDSFAGLWNINVGHGRRELVAAAAEQMAEVAFVPNFFGLASPPAIELATKLAEIFPGDLNHFQFTSGGAESNETALKMARYYWHLRGKPEKIKILSRKMGYHGIVMGALAATGIPAYHDGFGPMAPGFLHLTPPFQYRFGADGMSEADFVAFLVNELEETIAREGAGSIAAMIAEPVQGAGGVVVPPQAYWQAMAAVLKRHDILLIFDEVICGFGRTGTMFGMEQYGVLPDIASFAKGITSGYVPLGGVAITDHIFDVLSEPDKMFMHGFTYSGHPLACAVALPNIRIIQDENLPANAGRAGAYLLDRLSELLDRPYVGNVRGKGLMTFVEVVADKATKAKFEPSFNLGGKLNAATRAHGIIVRPVAEGIAMAPPLTIQQPELDFLANAIGAALDDVLG
ncbi:MAG: aspartate aminotransferase family protein [Chloroflexota bacterium]|nr:aspartate aminotransferase family protein [Chloroflexota bacterium]